MCAASRTYADIVSQNECAIDDETINALNGWATVVNRKSRGKKNRLPPTAPSPKLPDVFEKVTLQTEKDLDRMIQCHPQIAALPKDDAKIRQILKSKPVELECGPNEVLCLVDSGSTINAACIEKHFPAFKHTVKSTKKSRAGDFATTAGGHKLYNRGRCKIPSVAQKQPFPVTFKDMKVELPILSVRKIVKLGNLVAFDTGGGFIMDKTSRKKILFYEYEGVYFLKLQVDPDTSHAEPAGFGRLGSP